jgi:N utilization substance protein A
VAAKQEGIDPVGCCVGLRGIRIQNIVSELNGEKIDVVLWSPQAGTFIASALSPAQVLNVGLNEEENIATVVIPDKQLSLAIGREGQNVRLAAKLTEWRIDIKSASDAEAQRLAAAETLAETEEEVMEEEAVSEELPDEVATMVPEGGTESTEAVEIDETAQPVPARDTAFVPQGVPFEPKVEKEKSGIRFAEDIQARAPVKPETTSKKKKKKKKGGVGKESAVDGIKLKKVRRGPQLPVSEDDEY